jgi:hypothetical protein
MNVRSLGVSLTLLTGFACGVTEATPDAGTPPALDASTRDAANAANDSGNDSGNPTSDASDACDVSRPFGAPVTIRVGAAPLEVLHFRLAKAGTRAYFVTQNEIGSVRAGTLSDDVVNDVKIEHTAPLGIPGGFAISDDEKQLALAASAPSLEILVRASAGVPFGSSRMVSFAPPGTLPINHIYQPAFKSDRSIVFALNQRTNDNSTQIWDSYEGTLGADTISATVIAGLKPNPRYVFAPIVSNANRMFLASWGHAEALYYPRVFEATRTGGNGSWNAPARLAIPSLVLNETNAGPIDTVVPLDASTDGCTLYFGKGTDYLGKYQVLRVQRPR